MLEHSQLDNLHKSLNASAISRQQNISEHNPVPERKEQAVHNDQVDLNKIETEIKKVVSDNKRMANFQKVIACALLYQQATSEEERTESLLAIRQSAADYLLRRKTSSSPERKALCERLISYIDEYASQINISVSRDLSYMTGNRHLTTDEINNELSLAHDLVSDKPLGEITKERRERFKQKLADVKLTRGYLKDIEKYKNKKKEFLKQKSEAEGLVDGVNERYDNCLTDAILWYARANNLKDEAMATMLCRMKADDNNDAEGQTGLQLKVRQIETILFDIMSWDMSDFTFARTDDFLHRKEKGETEKEHLLKLYSKLQVAKHADLLLGEVLRLEKRFDTPLDFSKKTLEEMKVRIKIYKEIEKDYSERMAIMSSPYYALLEKEDIDGAMTEISNNKLLALKEEKEIPLSHVKRKVPAEFSKYIDTLFLKKERMDETKISDYFTRHSDLEGAIEYHLKKKDIYTKERKSRLTREGNEVRKALAQDVLELKQYKEGGEAVQKNKAENIKPQVERQNIDNSMRAVQGRSFVPVERPNSRIGLWGKLKNYGMAGARWMIGATVGLVGSIVGKAIAAPKQLKEKERAAGAQKKRIHGFVPGTKDERFADEHITDSDDEENLLFDFRRFPLIWEKMTAGNPESPPEVTIMTAQSMRGKRGADIWAGMGHAMIGLSYSRYNKATKRKERYCLKMGFYPGGGLTKVNHLMMASGALMQGQIRNDYNHDFDIARKYKVKTGDINRILKATETYADGGYGYYKRNCATYVTDMAKLANLPIAGDIEKEIIDFTGVVSNGLNIAVGANGFGKNIAANDIADKFQKTDISYENFGQKMTTKEDLDRYYDTVDGADLVRKGYSPGAIGEDLREADKGELTANYSEHSEMEDVQEFQNVYKDTGVLLAEEIRNRITEQEGSLKSYDQSICEMLASGSRIADIIMKSGKGVADEARAKHKEISSNMKMLNDYYAKRLKQDHLLNESVMKYLSLCEVALSFLDNAYTNNIANDYKGEVGTVLADYEADHEIVYISKENTEYTVSISPQIFMGYLKMGKTPTQIVTEGAEYVRINNIPEDERTSEDNKMFSKLERELITATAFGKASLFNLYKEEFTDKDLDFAFSELCKLEEKKEEGERFMGTFFLEKRPSYAYQAVILEKVISGLSSLNYPEESSDEQKISQIDAFISSKMSEKSELMKKILAAYAKGNEEKSPHIIADSFVQDSLTVYIKSALTEAGYQKRDIDGICIFITRMTQTMQWIESAVSSERNS